MFHLSEHLDAFAKERVRRRIVLLLPRETAEVGQSASDAPAIFELVENCEGAFVERASAGGVALIASDVTLIVQRPSDAFAVAQRPESGLAFSVEGPASDRNRLRASQRWPGC